MGGGPAADRRILARDAGRGRRGARRREHIDAGRAALAAGEWEAARDAFEASLARAPSAAAYEGHGFACRWLNEQEAAIRSLQRAFRLYRRPTTAAARRVWRLQLCFGECYFHADAGRRLGWIERAERLLEGIEPGAEQGWLTLIRGQLALQVGRDAPRARAHATAAREIGRDSGDVDVEMMALALEGLALVCEGAVEDGMRRLDEATAAAVAGELDDLDAISSCCCYLIDACKRVRDFERAAQWCEHVKGFCEQWSDRLTFAACRAHYADILIWRGDWTAAEAELRANLGPLADIHPNRIADGMVRLAELRRRQGLFEEADRLLEAADGHFLAPLVRAALALDRGDAAGAAHEAERSLRRLPDGGLTDRAPALEMLVRARLAAGDTDGARPQPASCGRSRRARAPPRAPRPRRSPTASWPPPPGSGRRRGAPSRTRSTSTRAPAGAGRQRTLAVSSPVRSVRSATTRPPSARRAPPTRRCARSGRARSLPTLRTHRPA